MLAGISLSLYLAEPYNRILNLVHRELYLFPIFLGAYWFGKKGGLTTAGSASVLYFAWVFTFPFYANNYYIENLIEVFIFNIIGYLIGMYHDAKVSYFAGLSENSSHLLTQPPSSHRKSILLCIDRSQRALAAAKYIADAFTPSQGTKVTILGIIQEPHEDATGSKDEWEKAKLRNEVTINTYTERARKILLQAGFAPDSIQIESKRANREGAVAKIIEERKRGAYDALVIGNMKMTKTQEFLFGNPAIKLVREANCPVITVN